MSAYEAHDFATDVMARLDQVAADGHCLTFWWRDDDAVAPTPALTQLLSLVDHFSVPLALAVIPKPVEDGLAGAVADLSGVFVLQHGYAHHNHQPKDMKSAELGDARPPGRVLAELQRGFDRLAELFPKRFLPVLVPPWNRIAPAIAGRRREVGLQGLSVFGAADPEDIQVVNTHVDLIAWRSGRGFIGYEKLRDRLFAEIDRRVGTGSSEPIGILSHHLVHDAECWRFLETFLALSSNHPAARWTPPGALFAPG